MTAPSPAVPGESEERAGARYAVTIYQSNWRQNRVSVEVVANDAAEAKRKALALAPRIHSPIVNITSIAEVSP